MFRRRIAIGTFANMGDLEVMVGRLQALGITRYERLLLPPDQSSPDPAAAGTSPALVRPEGAASGLPILRIYLETSAQEQAVAGALLAGAACSVQLHDI